MATRMTIVDGPSKWDLILAFFHGSEPHRHQVEFVLKPEGRSLQKKRVIIQELSRVTGNDTDWGFECLYNVGKHDIRRAEGVYSTHTRDGWIEMPA